MHSLNFDDGYKEFMINDDPNRVIRFNPTDFSIVDRFHTAANEVDALIAGLDMEKDVSAIMKLDEKVKEQIDYIFNQPVSQIVFGNQSALTPVKGRLLCERFLETVLPVIKENIKEEKKKSAERVGKYVKAARNV